MSRASLRGSGGYPNDWEPIYDTCPAAANTVCRHIESAFFCHSCDELSRVGDPTAWQHQRLWVCSACENAPAAFTCLADAASLCINCDIDIHSANQIARRHNHVPIPPLSGLGFAASTNPLEKLHTENETFLGNKCDDKLEEEIDSWLLLHLDENDNNSNGLFTYGEKAGEYWDPLEYNLFTEYQCQDQNYQNQLSSSHQEDDRSDSVAPVQSFDENEQQQQEEQIYFDREHEASQAAFINNTSSSQWVIKVIHQTHFSSIGLTFVYSSSFMFLNLLIM